VRYRTAPRPEVVPTGLANLVRGPPDIKSAGATYSSIGPLPYHAAG
jgi:hypothetical protein